MLTPTPMLRPSPLEISGLFAGTFQALRRRFGLFALITVFPVALGVVLIIVGVAIAVSSAVMARSGSGSSFPIGFLIGMAFYFVGIFAAALGQLKSYAMMAVAAYEIAQGQRPDFRGLLTRTRGFLPRMAPVIAIAVGCGVVFVGLFFALIAGSIGSLSNIGTRGRGGAALAGFFGIIALFVVVLVPLTYFLRTKLLYTIPATAIEGVGGIQGMQRSWRLTSGSFWRTLGYYLVAAIAVSVVTSIVSGIGQVAVMPMFAMTRSGSGSADPSAVLASLAAAIPVLVIMFVLVLAVELAAVPFLQIYETYMYIDQVHRSEMPAVPYGYGPAAPGYGYGYGQQPQQPYAPQPGTYYGQPAQGYPQPGQGYPQPGQGYPVPGQGYPPPAQYPQQASWQTPSAPEPQAPAPQPFSEPPADQGQQPPQDG